MRWKAKIQKGWFCWMSLKELMRIMSHVLPILNGEDLLTQTGKHILNIDEWWPGKGWRVRMKEKTISSENWLMMYVLTGSWSFTCQTLVMLISPCNFLFRSQTIKDMPHRDTQVLATPGDNSIDHTVRAVHSYPGPWEEARTLQIYTASKKTVRRRRKTKPK